MNFMIMTQLSVKYIQQQNSHSLKLTKDANLDWCAATETKIMKFKWQSN